jgi:hypothetical protein
MFEQCAARIVNEVDTIDEFAMGMLVHKMTDDQLKQEGFAIGMLARHLTDKQMKASLLR